MPKDNSEKLKKYIKDDRPSKLKSYIKKHHIDVAAVTLSKKRTLLHYCCKHGSGSVLRYLIKTDISPAVTDKSGATCLHLALRRMLDTPSSDQISELYTELVLPLIQRNPTLLEKSDHEGISARDLLKTVKRKQDRLSQQDKQSDASSTTDEDDFRQRLSEEMGEEYHEDMGKYEREDDHYEGCETNDEWVNRIHREHNLRKRTYNAQHAPKKKAKSTSKDDTKDAQDKLKRAREEMEKRYEKKRKQQLEMQIKLSKTSYEDSFRKLSSGAKTIKYKDIPWPFICQPGVDTIKKFLLSDMEASDHEMKKKYLRKQQVRWHPDKFLQKVGKLLDECDREKILETVNEVSQIINNITSSL